MAQRQFAMRPREAEAGFTAALLAIIPGLFVWHCRVVGWRVVDDAGIFLAFGRTLFEGHGVRATGLSQVVEGVSSPLWTVLAGLPALLPIDPERFLSGLSISCGAVGLVIFGLWGPVASGRSLQVEDAVAPLVALANPSFAAWVSSGMETGLLTLALAIAGALTLRAVRTGNGTAAGVALGLLLWCRPEAPLYAAAIGAAGLAMRPAWNPVREALIPAVAIGAALLVLRWVLFADLVPNTWWAKRGTDYGGHEYLATFLLTYGTTVWAVGLGLLASFGSARTRGQGALVAALLAAIAVFSLSVRGDWMREWRFLVPAVPLWGAAVAAGLSSARDWKGRGWRRATAGVVLDALAVWGGLQAFERDGEVKVRAEFSFDYVKAVFTPIEQTLRSLGQRRARVAFPDLGGQAWLLRDAELLDLAALADRALAWHSGNPAAQEDYLISEGLPALLDAHGPSGYVKNFTRLMASYDPPGDVWRLKGMTRDEDPRCPGGKAAVLALAPEALRAEVESELLGGDPLTALARYQCAWTYQPEEQLPSPAARSALAALAAQRSQQAEREGKLELALRCSSAATWLAGQPAHARRRTEQLRERLFPRD